MKFSGNGDLRLKESFNREYAALEDLCSHENIVTLIDAGKDTGGVYMVLEWVPSNLLNWIEKRGAIGWEGFYTGIGRPVLNALVFAQSRG